MARRDNQRPLPGQIDSRSLNIQGASPLYEPTWVRKSEKPQYILRHRGLSSLSDSYLNSLTVCVKNNRTDGLNVQLTR